MRLASKVIALAAVGVLSAAAATPAEALWVRPSTVAFTDSSGATNGCIAEIPPLQLIGEGADRQIVASLVVVTCPPGSEVHRTSYSVGVYEVLRYGELRTVRPFSRYGTSSSPQAVIGPDLFNVFIPCAANDGLGAHTWLIRARINAKHTQDNSDPNPYVAKVDRKQRVTC